MRCNVSELSLPLARWIWGMGLAAALNLTPLVHAHPADVTLLRLKVEKQNIECQFTFTLLTLSRMVSLDINGDQKLDTAELKACTPALAAFLQQHVRPSFNSQQTSLGIPVKVEPFWPVTDSVDLREVDRAVDVIFRLSWPEVIANFQLEFIGFQQWGELATIQATYEQGDLRMQVPFSAGEPDYLYDTGFAVEDIFQAPTPVKPTVASLWKSYAAGVLVFVTCLLLIFRKFTKG